MDFNCSLRNLYRDYGWLNISLYKVLRCACSDRVIDFEADGGLVTPKIAKQWRRMANRIGIDLRRSTLFVLELKRASDWQYGCFALISRVTVTKREKRKKIKANDHTHRISSKISGFSRSLCFILSFIAVIMLFALSSAPCFVLFSAAPVRTNEIVKFEIHVWRFKFLPYINNIFSVEYLNSIVDRS